MISMQAESEEIHKNLRKSVKLFSYWVRNIETYVKKSHQLFKCEQEIVDIRKLIGERSTSLSQAGTSGGTPPERLPTLIRLFNNEQKVPIAIKNAFEKFKDEREITVLCLEDFQNIPEQTIKELFDSVKPQTVKNESGTEDKTRVTEITFRNSIQDLISAIKLYQLAIKSDEDLNEELDSNETKEKEIIKVLRRIEELKFGNSNPSQTKSKKADSTNFVAAEMGFMIEVPDEGNEERLITKYYHYPITFSNKNTFSIYDLQNEEFNYFLFKKGKIYHNNYIVDNVIIKPSVTGEGRSEADPSNDNHSESVLFFLCQQRAFHEKMISELVKDLKKEDLKLAKLERLILEIHSSRDICFQCFQKAEYLMNWKEENGNQGNHFLSYYKKVFTKMLEKGEVLGQNSKIKLKVEIRFSYDKPYDKASKKPHHRFHRISSNDDNTENSQCSITHNSGRTLSNYSIITSGGVAKSHNYYCHAYNKAVDPARTYTKDDIENAWQEQWLS